MSTAVGGGTASLVAQELDFLPQPVLERIGEVEQAMQAWEDRRTEVIEQLSIQPWEEEEEYARRVDRAVARGAGREFRFLQFQLNELEQYSFSVDREHVILAPEDRPQPGQPWILEVQTDLGFLPEPDRFAVSIQPVEGVDSRGSHADLVRAVENESLRGRISYTVGGHTDGSFRITLDLLHLTDASRPGPAFRSVPINRHYSFSRYEPITVIQPVIRFDFGDGTMPEEFETTETAPWRIVSDHAYSGDYVLRAGDIDHSMYTEVRYPVPVPTGAARARISFAVRTSSEQRYDFLGFHVEGERLETWSGVGDWTTASYEIDVAARDRLLLRWRYEKDGSVSQGEDTAWVDEIRVEFE